MLDKHESMKAWALAPEHKYLMMVVVGGGGDGLPSKVVLPWQQPKSIEGYSTAALLTRLISKNTSVEPVQPQWGPAA